MVRFIQINTNTCQAAQALLQQVSYETHSDVILVSEQYQNIETRWYSDKGAKAAIHVVSTCLRITNVETPPSEGWTWVETVGLRIYSVYLSPNSPFNEFVQCLDKLEESIRASTLPVVVAGDFNAKAPEWGSSKIDRRGSFLCDLAARLHLQAANVGTNNTFVRGSTGSVIDVTFVSESITNRVKGWRVLDTYSHSDHRYVVFEIDVRSQTPAKVAVCGWSVNKLDHDAFDEIIASKRESVVGAEAACLGAEEIARSLNDLLRVGCDASMPRRGGPARRAPAYWWNDTIADLRRECLSCRRRLQRQSTRDDHLNNMYKIAKRSLNRAIKDSKARCWEQLIKSVNDDPWGRPYRMIRKKLQTGKEDHFLNNITNLEAVISELFPQHPPIEQSSRLDAVEEGFPLFTTEELLAATKKIKNGKAPGPDCVPNIIIKRAAKLDPELLLTALNSCLSEGTFATPWKRQKLVLIPKGKGALAGPAAYRPLCMLDGVGKLLERMLLQRLQLSLEDTTNGLSQAQYGFRPGRSTIDAINTVIKTVRDAWQGSVKQSKHVVLIALDIRNAFNTASWKMTIDALANIKAPAYLVRIIKNYFANRVLEYNCMGKIYQRAISAGVPQGSVLGPALWNAMYDGLLRVPMPSDASIVAFADDVAILVTAKTTSSLCLAAKEALAGVKSWLAGAGLRLAVEKTEAVFFSRKRQLTPPALDIDGFKIPYSRTIRYLGVVLDDKLRFSKHAEMAAAKAARAGEQLARLMPNVGGPKYSRRRLYNEVVHSILLYGAPIWAESTRVEKTRLSLARVQRTSALRVVSAYRTVSEDATLAIAAITPVDLLALERQAIYRGQSKTEAKKLSMERWQERWDASSKGRWTHKLIPQLKPWCNRKHGDLSYHLTQMLTGHGCFGAYLHRIGKEVTAACHHCEEGDDDVAHTIIWCPAWQEERDRLKETLGGDVEEMSPESMVPSMLRDAEAWSAWATFSSTVLKKKEEAERGRRRQFLNLRTSTSVQ